MLSDYVLINSVKMEYAWLFHSFGFLGQLVLFSASSIIVLGSYVDMEHEEFNWPMKHISTIWSMRQESQQRLSIQSNEEEEERAGEEEPLLG